jgi:single-stranded-DNA-specific exonuclease
MAFVGRWHNKHWNILQEGEEQARLIQSQLGCHPIIARMLVNRGIMQPEEAQAFLHPSFNDLSDPFLLPDAEAAVERIKQALRHRERIYIHGDYDSDGVTSAALWYRLLTRLGADVLVHIPHRHRDGYDMRSKFVVEAKERGAAVILTTDCGIQRWTEVEEAREAGIDVIVTDHHEPGSQLPKAVAVVNPHRSDSRYPFPYLAGVGVAFRLGEALLRHLGHSVDGYRRALCDLAAIGTITDIMPVLGENRIIVKQGLETLRQGRKAGLRALMQLAKLNPEALTVRDIGFALGPRINAVGRMDDARIALDLLITEDPAEARELAERLERANVMRQEEQARITQEATQQIQSLDLEENPCIVLYRENWNSGVIGVVANKITSQFHRPSVLISVDPESGTGRGSARSIRAFDIHQALTECQEYLLEFGGHAHAAGMTIQLENLPAIIRSLNRLASERLTPDDFLPTIDIEAEIEASEVTPRLLEDLKAFEPYGHDNEEPIFVSRGLQLMRIYRMGPDGMHLKLFLKNGRNNEIAAVYWRNGELEQQLQCGDYFDICYRPKVDQYNGKLGVQLVIQDLRPSE